MCHFILTILPPDADISAIETLCEKYGRDFKPAAPDERTVPWMESGELCYWTTGGVCDCGTALLLQDMDYYSERNSDAELAKRVEKLRKKGWGQHKIDSWLSQKTEMREMKQHGAAEEKSKDKGRWHSLLREILAQRLSSYVGLLVLWDDKETVIKGRNKMKLFEDFAPFEENTIYTFSGRDII